MSALRNVIYGVKRMIGNIITHGYMEDAKEDKEEEVNDMLEPEDKFKYTFREIT